jgi:Pyridine nucleotide-disulphide oxidoreductase, dimerisation domain
VRQPFEQAIPNLGAGERERSLTGLLLGHPRRRTFARAHERWLACVPTSVDAGRALARTLSLHWERSLAAAVSEVAKTATYTRAYASANRFVTLLSDGGRLTGAYALGRETGEWLQQATLAIRASVSLDVLRDTIQPFPTFSEIYVAALKARHDEIAAAREPAGHTVLR